MSQKKIADISKWQGTIDWEKARTELDLVIFRASIGRSIDSKFLANVAACGVPFGVYHYVKAGTADEARAEARFFVECVRKAACRPNFYIADIEYKTQTATTTEAVCVAFLEELRSLGCEKIGLYINTRYKWAGRAIAMCDIMWVPRYGKNTGEVPGEEFRPKYPCDLWQYTSAGALAGVKGNVDLNILYGGKPLSYFSECACPEETGGSGGTMLNNFQFAAFCREAYASGWVYWYGTYGNECTQSRYEAKAKQYPKHYTSARKSGYMKDISGKKTCSDCVGLIKSFFWKGGDIGATPKYASNGCPDKSADGMFALCKESGPIATMPDIPGLVVWKPGHIGVHIGGRKTVEMKGFSYDCVMANVNDGPWTKWGKLPESMLAYISEPADGPIDAADPNEPDAPDVGSGEKIVVIRSSGGKVNLRIGNGTSFAKVGQVAMGAKLPYVAMADNGWNAVVYGKQVAWVSGNYSDVKEV